MKVKGVITALLLAFVAASAAWLVVKEIRAGRAPQERIEAQAGPAQGTPKLTVYYFHGSVRCPTCNRIEALTHEAVRGGFAGALKSGEVGFKAVNADQPANEHFTRDYRLFTKSVVLVESRGGRRGRWKNLDRVWELVADGEAFKKYVREETKAFLAGK